MAYKPPKQTIVDNDLKGVPSNEAVFEGLKLKLPKPPIDGTSGQLLSRGATADDTSWVNPPAAGFANPMTTTGDIIVGGTSGTAQRLGLGATDKVLVSDGTTISYQYAGLGGGAFGTNNIILGRDKPSYFSGTSNILIGSNTGSALGTSVQNILIGINAGSDVFGPDNIALGYFALSNNFIASSSDNTIAIGRQAGSAIDSGLPRSTQVKSILLGSFANYLNYSDSSIVIGHEANRTTTGVRINTTGCIVLGREAYSDNLSNIFTAGSANYPINTAYFGKGAKAIAGANLTNFTLTVGRALGSDQSAATGTLTLAGSQGTGTGTGGDVIISTAPASLSSGTSLNAHVERVRVTAEGKVGIGTASPTAELEVNGNVLANEYRVPNYRLDPHTHDEGTETGNFTINWANGAVHTVTIDAAGPLTVTMNNPVNGGAYALRIIQGATPGTIDFTAGSFANVKWPGGTPPTLSATTGDVDIINFLYFDDGGGNTYYYATFALDFA